MDRIPASQIPLPLSVAVDDMSRLDCDLSSLAMPSPVSVSIPAYHDNVANANVNPIPINDKDDDSKSADPTPVPWGIVLAKANAQRRAEEDWAFEVATKRPGFGTTTSREEKRKETNRKSAKISRLRFRHYSAQLEEILVKSDHLNQQLAREIHETETENNKLQRELIMLSNCIPWIGDANSNIEHYHHLNNNSINEIYP